MARRSSSAIRCSAAPAAPTTGGPACFPGNVIPADRIDPLGRAILNLFPTPNFFDVSVSNRQYNHADTDIPNVYRTLHQVTIDHNFTDNDRVSTKYRHWRPNREATTGTFGINSNWNHFRSQYAQKEDAITVNYTRLMTRQLVNEMSFGYRNTPEVAPVDSMPEPIAKLQREPNGLGSLGSLYNTPTLNQLDLYPQLTFTGVPGTPPNVAWDARFPIDAIDLRWSLQNNLTWTAGRHLVKAGIYYEYNINSEGFSATCFSGCLDFTSNSVTAAQNPFNTNHPYANALLGYYTTYAESNSRPFRGANQWNLEWFTQDSWKVRSNLTLELGVRFASGTPWHLQSERVERVQPAAGRAGGGLARRGLRRGAQSGRCTCRRARHRRSHVRGHGAAGEESAHRRRSAELRRAHRTALAEQRRLLQRIDSRQRSALERRHLPAQSRYPCPTPTGLLVGSDRPAADGHPRRLRHHRAALRRVGQLCGHVPVVGAGQAPADPVLWRAVRSRQRAIGVLAVAGDRMDTERVAAPG